MELTFTYIIPIVDHRFSDQQLIFLKDASLKIENNVSVILTVICFQMKSSCVDNNEISI